MEICDICLKESEKLIQLSSHVSNLLDLTRVLSTKIEWNEKKITIYGSICNGCKSYIDETIDIATKIAFKNLRNGGK